MAEENRPFKLLTNEEYNRLSRVDKVNYLADAVGIMKDRTNSRARLFAPSRTKLKPKRD